ncbi:hypothetical protein GCM10025865_23370 [Paraoerskovia sediminicola]|uniref:ABC-2 type transport system permease protein n=1 Tax=Paraoerskovia sediminicola TaxID=1138587 RepID=A0ABN6XG19_9CELL|nr:ABC transporter permease subunit [Paraoerskovia sediminicola]BDZ43038.1 hypothetical protein GCM10025865_23370 [Paraoerskovia sediminicola]
MRLLRVELLRFRSRALIRWGAAGAVLIGLLFVFGAYQSSAPVPQAEIDAARADYDEAVADWEENGAEYTAECEEEEAAEKENDPTVDFGCEDGGPGEWSDWIGGTSSFSDVGLELVDVAGVVYLMVALVLGVTFSAAEMSTGAISSWLTFEPRRRRVYWSKLAAAAIGVLPIVAVALGVVVGGAWLAFTLNDAQGSMTTGAWAGLAWVLARTLLGAAAFAALGVALGVLTRSTAGALGLVFAWLVVVEMIFGTMEFFGGLKRFLLAVNTQAWVSGRATYYTETCVASDDRGIDCTYAEHVVPMTQGGLVLAVLVVVVCVTAAVTFRRRDIA